MNQAATVSIQPPDTFSIYSYNNQKPGMYLPIHINFVQNHSSEIRGLCSTLMPVEKPFKNCHIFGIPTQTSLSFFATSFFH